MRALRLVTAVGSGLVAGRLLFGVVGAERTMTSTASATSDAHTSLSDADVTIVIVARDEEISIRATLERLVKVAPESGIVVVDDGSRDRTAMIVGQLQEEHDSIELVSGDRVGKMAGLRSAALELERPLTLTVDADTLVDEGAIVALVREIERGRLDACAGNMRPSARSTFSLRMQRHEFALLNADRRALARFGGVSVLPGAFTLWRTEVLRSLVFAARNDIDLAFDALLDDRRLGFAADARCETLVPDRYRDVLQQRRRWARRKLFRAPRSASTVLSNSAPRRARLAQAHVVGVHVLVALFGVVLDLGVLRSLLVWRRSPRRAAGFVALYLSVALLQDYVTRDLVDRRDQIVIRLCAGPWERWTRSAAAWSVVLLPRSNDVGWTPKR